jgi:hypothetical protein
MKRFLIAISAAALSAALLVGSPAFAQEQTADAVMTGMSELGINVEGLVLTEEQVLQVEAILNGTDADAEKVAQINQLLGL